MSTEASLLTSRPDGPVGRVWRLLGSLKLAVILLLLLSVATIVGTLLTQVPPEVAASTRAYDQWLARARESYGALADPLSTLDLFAIFRSPLYWGLVTLLGLNLVVCTLNRVRGTWRVVFGPTVRVGDRFLSRSAHRAAVTVPRVPAEAVASVWNRVLGREGFRTISQVDGDTVYLYADRNHLARLGTLLVHGGLLVLLLGVLAGSFLGFRDTEFMVTEGETRPVGHGSGLSIRLEDFTDEYYPTGEPKDYRSEVVVIEDGREVKRGTVRTSDPLVYGGVSFHQSFFGYAARMEIKDSTGGTVFAGTVPLAYSINERQSGYLVVPERDLEVLLVWTAGMAPGMGDMAAMGYRNSTQEALFNLSLNQGQPQTTSGLTFSFQGLREFAGLQVKNSPALPFVWAGGAMLLLGTVAALHFPHRRLWALSRPSMDSLEFLLAGLSTRDPSFGRNVSRLSRRLESEFSGRPGEPLAREGGEPNG